MTAVSITSLSQLMKHYTTHKLHNKFLFTFSIFFYLTHDMTHTRTQTHAYTTPQLHIILHSHINAHFRLVNYLLVIFLVSLRFLSLFFIRPVSEFLGVHLRKDFNITILHVVSQTLHFCPHCRCIFYLVTSVTVIPLLLISLGYFRRNIVVSLISPRSTKSNILGVCERPLCLRVRSDIIP